MTRDWMGLSETAQLLGVHPSTVRAWADSGKLPVHRTAGGHRRFSRADIEALRRETGASGTQIVIENAIGRTRMQVAEGSLEGQSWYQKLNGAQRRAYREESHRLLQQVSEYVATDSPGDAQLIGRDYARISLDANMTLSEAVAAFLFFRNFLMESIYSLQDAQTPASREQFHQQASQYTDQVLMSLIETYQSGQTV